MTKKTYKIFNSYDNRESEAAKKVLKSGILSKFLGQYDKDFYGGKYVQKFERYIEKYFNVKYAVTVNSWTSGLVACVGAIDIEPGDEIILPPRDVKDVVIICLVERITTSIKSAFFMAIWLAFSLMWDKTMIESLIESPIKPNAPIVPINP